MICTNNTSVATGIVLAADGLLLPLDMHTIALSLHCPLSQHTRLVNALCLCSTGVKHDEQLHLLASKHSHNKKSELTKNVLTAIILQNDNNKMQYQLLCNKNLVYISLKKNTCY